MLAPIPGQPGMFRSLRGLGDAATDAKRTALETRVRQVEDELRQARESLRPLLDLFPGVLDTRRVESAWDVLKRIPRASLADTVVRLSQETSVSLIKGVLLSAANNLDLARTLLGMPPLRSVTDEQFTQSIPRIERLLSTTSSGLAALRRYAEEAQSITEAPARAMRAVGLGIHPAIIVAGIVVAGVVVYALYSQFAAMIDANVSAIAACVADAAAGRPCTGDQFLEYQRRASERADQQGLLPSIRQAAEKAQNTAQLLVVAAAVVAVGALIYTSAPALRVARSEFEVEARGAVNRLRARRT